MRKAHYTILADVIKRHVQATQKAEHYSEDVREMLILKFDSIADCFARECKLDRDSFLVACGLLKR